MNKILNIFPTYTTEDYAKEFWPTNKTESNNQ